MRKIIGLINFKLLLLIILISLAINPLTYINIMSIIENNKREADFKNAIENMNVIDDYFPTTYDSSYLPLEYQTGIIDKENIDNGWSGTLTINNDEPFDWKKYFEEKR